MPPDDQDEFDYLEGTDPDDIALGPDAIAVDLDRPNDRSAAELSPHPRRPLPPARAGRISAAKGVAFALAFALLGYGLATAGSGWRDRANAVDVGFSQDMIDHHDQAVSMALALLGKDDIDVSVRTAATEVLIFQRWETGIMDTYLADWNEPRGDLDRSAMNWMDMVSAVGSMPGMQTEARMDELRASQGRQAEQLFLSMMREHHLGGVHMGQYAAEHASNGDVRELAARMARYQQVEANEYTAMLQRLDLQ